MDNNDDEQLLITKAIIEANRQDTNEKQMKTYEKLKKITE